MIKRVILRLAVLTFVLGFSLTIGELLVRAGTGHRVWSWKAERVAADPAQPAGSREGPDLAALAGEVVGPLVARGEADPTWIAAQPERDPAPGVDAELQTLMTRFPNVAVCYVFNERWLKSARERGTLGRFLPAGHPDELLVFEAIGEEAHPVYRFPASRRLPTGLVTNRYGMRGREYALEKPERVVRIGCIGASTTVCGHALGWSWPELLEHWLNAWSERRGLEVRFQVINAGREGIRSSDIVAIYEQEVRPFDCDWVFYYEGSNQFHLQKAVRWEGPDRYASPPDGITGSWQPEVGGQEPEGLQRWSVIAQLVAGAAEASRVAGGEPAKPEQAILWPDGQDEQRVSLEALDGDFLSLQTILGDLDRLREAVRADGGRLMVGSYCWLVGEDIAFDPFRDRAIFDYLNRRFWPIRFDVVARLVAFQNRVLSAWCREHGVVFADVAARMPREPALYVDPIHVNDAGVRARGWVILESLLPAIGADLQDGRLPRRARPGPRVHPATRPPQRFVLRGG